MPELALPHVVKVESVLRAEPERVESEVTGLGAVKVGGAGEKGEGDGVVDVVVPPPRNPLGCGAVTPWSVRFLRGFLGGRDSRGRGSGCSGGWGLRS